MPNLLSARPPPRALAWVVSSLGAARLTAVRHLPGGRSCANHLVTVGSAVGATRAVVLRRWVHTGWHDAGAGFGPDREIAALALLAAAGVRAPRLLSADVTGASCGDPALLLTVVPGSPPPASGPRPAHYTLQLAAAMQAVHDIAVEPGALPRYRPYHDLSALRPPAASELPGLWYEALAVAALPAPVAPAVLLHRDYHPGNTLWRAGTLTGIVDWTSASRGPAAVDVAHMRWNLAVSDGEPTAERFLAHCRSGAGGAGEHDPWWDVAAVVDLLGHDPGWPLGGPALTRLELHLRRVVAAARG